MKGKKLLTVFLATMLIFSSSVTVFASETKSTNREVKNVSSMNYGKSGDSIKKTSVSKYVDMFKNYNADKVCTTSKDVKIVKDSVPSKDYNLGKDANIGSAIRNAQEKAKEIVKTPVKAPVKVTPPKVVISQQLKDQIKAEYTAMRSTEVTNKAIFVSAINKKNQVISYIYKVAQGKITYTDAQLTNLDALSITFENDIKTITDATVSIKTDEAAVKASAKSKDFEAVLANLKTEAADRIARGTALTNVNKDLDAFLTVLVEGQAVLSTPITPVTKPAVVPAT